MLAHSCCCSVQQKACCTLMHLCPANLLQQVRVMRKTVSKRGCQTTTKHIITTTTTHLYDPTRPHHTTLPPTPPTRPCTPPAYTTSCPHRPGWHDAAHDTHRHTPGLHAAVHGHASAVITWASSHLRLHLLPCCGWPPQHPLLLLLHTSLLLRGCWCQRRTAAALWRLLVRWLLVLLSCHSQPGLLLLPCPRQGTLPQRC